MTVRTDMGVTDRGEEPARARIVIRTSLAALAEVVGFVETFAAARAVPRAVADDVNLCLDEILSNIVIHGFGERDDGLVVVELSLKDGMLRAEVEDGGPPFDPTQAPGPDLSGGIRERRVGGVGLLFVRELMDEMTYTWQAGRNRLRIAKRIEGSGVAPC